MESIHVFNQEAAAVQKQMDYLADQLATLENTMIDPKEFGALEAEVRDQRRDIERMLGTLELFGKKLDTIEGTLTAASGGWRMLMLVGGAGAAVASAVAWLLQNVQVKP